VLVLAAACSSAREGRPPSPPLLSSEGIALEGADAAVWGFSVDVHGALTGADSLASCRFERDAIGIMRAAITHGRTFQGLVPLSRGDNEIRARCATTGGKSLVSPPLRFTARLRARPSARPAAMLVAGQLVLVVPAVGPGVRTGSALDVHLDAACGWTP
jgi:hypothetical protein